MAVLAPVLERKLNVENTEMAESSRNNFMTADEHHNLCIKDNYAKLINPDTKVGDVIHKENTVLRQATEPVKQPTIVLVQNARATADIFRADSPINQKHSEAEPVQSEEDEENEDLRPTQTTIQYKTKAASKVTVDDKISNKKSKSLKLSKREIIIIAASLLVVIALFVLVIVNSAVLSNLNSEMSVLQADLASAKSSFAEALEAKEAYLDEQNILQVVREHAAKLGMFKI